MNIPWNSIFNNFFASEHCGSLIPRASRHGVCTSKHQLLCVCGGVWTGITSVFCEAQWHHRVAYDRLFCSPNSKGVLASSLPHSGPTSTACPGLLLWLLPLLELIPTILFLLPSLFHFFLSPVGLSCSLPPALWFILLYLLGVEFCLTTKEGWGFN